MCGFGSAIARYVIALNAAVEMVTDLRDYNGATKQQSNQHFIKWRAICDIEKGGCSPEIVDRVQTWLGFAVQIGKLKVDI